MATKHNPFVQIKNCIPDSEVIHTYLENNIEWQDGIKSKHGFTRKAKPLIYGEDLCVDTAIRQAVKALFHTNPEVKDMDLEIMGIYLNYYMDGKMYTPMHKHPDSYQLIISLGSPRTFRINKKEFITEGGDVLFFGSQMHGVPKEEHITSSRISIAVFLSKFEVC